MDAFLLFLKWHSAFMHPGYIVVLYKNVKIICRVHEKYWRSFGIQVSHANWRSAGSSQNVSMTSVTLYEKNV